MQIVEFPFVVIREGVAAASVVGCVTVVFLLSSPTNNISAHLQVKIMATNAQSTVKRTIQVLGKYFIDPIDSLVDLLHLLSEFIGIVDDKVSRPLIIKYSPKMNVPLQTLKHRFDNSKRTEQKLKLGQSGWWDEL